ALGARFSAMKARMRSSVSVVMRPPLRRRLASLPSLTARRPNVDSASPVWRQKSEISRKMASFMRCPRRFLVRRIAAWARLVPRRTSVKRTNTPRFGKPQKVPSQEWAIIGAKSHPFWSGLSLKCHEFFLKRRADGLRPAHQEVGNRPAPGEREELCRQRGEHRPRHCRGAVAAAELARLDALREGAIDGVLDAAAGLDGGGVVVAVAQPVEHHGG